MFLVCHFQPGSPRSWEEGKRSRSACRRLEAHQDPAVSQPLQDYEVSFVLGVRARATLVISVMAWWDTDLLLTISAVRGHSSTLHLSTSTGARLAAVATLLWRKGLTARCRAAPRSWAWHLQHPARHDCTAAVPVSSTVRSFRSIFQPCEGVKTPLLSLCSDQGGWPMFRVDSQIAWVWLITTAISLQLLGFL